MRTTSRYPNESTEEETSDSLTESNEWVFKNQMFNSGGVKIGVEYQIL